MRIIRRLSWQRTNQLGLAMESRRSSLILLLVLPEIIREKKVVNDCAVQTPVQIVTV